MQAVEHGEENPQKLCDISTCLKQKYMLNIYQVSRRTVRRTSIYKETIARVLQTYVLTIISWLLQCQGRLPKGSSHVL